MSKASTNVELNPISVVGGEVITDTKEITKIPPEGKLNKVSDPQELDVVKIELAGKWPPEQEKTNEANEKSEYGD